jgi:hypothetical protein
MKITQTWSKIGFAGMFSAVLTFGLMLFGCATAGKTENMVSTQVSTPVFHSVNLDGIWQDTFMPQVDVLFVFTGDFYKIIGIDGNGTREMAKGVYTNSSDSITFQLGLNASVRGTTFSRSDNSIVFSNAPTAWMNGNFELKPPETPASTDPLIGTWKGSWGTGTGEEISLIWIEYNTDGELTGVIYECDPTLTNIHRITDFIVNPNEAKFTGTISSEGMTLRNMSFPYSIAGNILTVGNRAYTRQ